VPREAAAADVAAATAATAAKDFSDADAVDFIGVEMDEVQGASCGAEGMQLPRKCQQGS
jgi:hypothetical protein